VLASLRYLAKAAYEAAAPASAIDPAVLARLGANLEGIWSAPTTDARLKKRN
jgi:hypothetical protein